MRGSPRGFATVQSKKGVEKDSKVLDPSNWKGKIPTKMGETGSAAHFGGQHKEFSSGYVTRAMPIFYLNIDVE